MISKTGFELGYEDRDSLFPYDNQSPFEGQQYIGSQDSQDMEDIS